MIQRLPVTFREDALADLQAIYLIVLERSGNEAVAGGFVQRIMARCRKIGDAPKGGRRRDDLFSGLRTVPFERRAVIAYLVRDHRIEITNIFYGGQDYEALYRTSPADD
ncbi:type II toxin-antitoxin system RelE/ParE family toxin [Allorhizobium pseudoryzae]|uniref:type II toxin-antitoxin system RelE/ParE family toxin n=1 Tax=Allorhizobium pseudoryzae TaxID=379684 RepID=UPI003D07C5AF